MVKCDVYIALLSCNVRLRLIHWSLDQESGIMRVTLARIQVLASIVTETDARDVDSTASKEADCAIERESQGLQSCYICDCLLQALKQQESVSENERMRE